MKNDHAPGNTVKLVIPASVVLDLFKDRFPIDATIVSAHLDESTNNLELLIASDFFRQPVAVPEGGAGK